MCGRYALVLGHSLVQSNGPFMEAEGVDMLMLTYPDSAFPPATLDSLQAVGWKMRNVSHAPLSCAISLMHGRVVVQ